MEKEMANHIKEAAEAGDREKLLTALGTTPSMTDLRTAWWESIKHKRDACMRMLLDLGTPVESRDPQSWTAMHHVANDGTVEMIKVLISYGANVDARSINARTPLHIAVRSKNEPVVHALLEEGAEIWNEDCNKYTALVYSSKHIGIMTMLLERMNHESDSGTEYRRRKQLNTTILNATLLESTDTLKLLFENGGDANAFDGRPLNTALMRGNATVVRTLLEGGARPSMCKMEVLRPLFVAVFKGHIECVKLLLQYGVDVNEKHMNGDTPLLVAASENQTPMVKYLVEHGAHVNHQGLREETALFSAVRHGCSDMTEILLNAGASVNIGITTTAATLTTSGIMLPIHNLLSLEEPLTKSHYQCLLRLLQQESEVDSHYYEKTYPDIALSPVILAWWNQHLKVFHCLQSIGCTIPRRDISHLTTRRQVLHSKDVPSETLRSQLEQMPMVPELQALTRRTIRKIFRGRLQDMNTLELPFLVKEYLDYSSLF